MTAEEEFNNDIKLMLLELKREDLANAYSNKTEIKFYLSEKSESRPSRENQIRIIKMLADRKAITVSPFYHTMMAILDDMLYEQGMPPVGYRINIIKPNFNEVYEEYIILTDEDKKKINANFNKNENKLRVSDKNIGFITLDDGGEFKVGPADNVPFKMLEVFCPFGKNVSIDSAYDKTSPENSKDRRANLSPIEKEDKLKTRIKELQGILPKKRIKVRLKFNESEGTVFMEKYI